MIKELHLIWVPNFIALGVYFPFGLNLSWNEETENCFNVNFLGGYLVVTARYLMVTTPF